MSCYKIPTAEEIAAREATHANPITLGNRDTWRRIGELLSCDLAETQRFAHIQRLRDQAPADFDDFLAGFWSRGVDIPIMLRYKLLPRTAVASAIAMMSIAEQQGWLDYCRSIDYYIEPTEPAATIQPQTKQEIRDRRSAMFERSTNHTPWPTIRAYLLACEEAAEDLSFDEIGGDVDTILNHVDGPTLSVMIEGLRNFEDIRLVLRTGLAARARISAKTVQRLPTTEQPLWAEYLNI